MSVKASASCPKRKTFTKWKMISSTVSHKTQIVPKIIPAYSKWVRLTESSNKRTKSFSTQQKSHLKYFWFNKETGRVLGK
jgi:hypothetical protein